MNSPNIANTLVQWLNTVWMLFSIGAYRLVHVRYRVWVRYWERPLIESWLYIYNKCFVFAGNKHLSYSVEQKCPICIKHLNYQVKITLGKTLLSTCSWGDARGTTTTATSWAKKALLQEYSWIRGTSSTYILQLLFICFKKIVGGSQSYLTPPLC